MEITCWGDSLTAGTWLGAGQDFPTVLASQLGVVANNFGVGGEDSSQILTRVLADSAHVNDIVIFWMGHNNTDRAQVVLDVASAVAHLGSNQKFIVLSVLNRTNEGKGSTDYPAVIAMNAALATAYPLNYLDIRSYLVHQYDPSTVQGNADHAADMPAFALDTVHRTAIGQAKVADAVAAFIVDKGWLNGNG